MWRGLVAALLLGAAVLLGVGVDARLGTFRAQEEVLYFSSAEQLLLVAPGFESLMADVYWLRTVQYFGHAMKRGQGGPQSRVLPTLVQITTTLDPKFRVAYLGGATFVAEPPPVGLGDGHEAVRILERGARELPNDWIIQQHLGYSIYLYLGDAHRAAERLTLASRLPGAPFWLETLAAGLLGQGGERDKARLLWRRIEQDSEIPALRLTARLAQQRLDGLDVLDALDLRLERFRAAEGRLPGTQAEFRAVTAGLPSRDPDGVPFVFDPRKERFEFGPGSRLSTQLEMARKRPARGATTPDPARP